MPQPELMPLSEGESRPRPVLPLDGLTLLTVEDSRFASEALRLLCQRSGARLRRAETIEIALRHLSVYRPDVVIVDLGLPDGDGADLIRSLSRGTGTGIAVLGTSSDPDGRVLSNEAGAAGYLEKPLASLSLFQSTVLRCLPDRLARPVGPESAPLRPDPFSLQDDLTRAAALLLDPANPRARRYAARFIGSVAHSAQDRALAEAAGSALATPSALPGLRALLTARLAAAPHAFAPDAFAPAETPIPLSPVSR